MRGTLKQSSRNLKKALLAIGFLGLLVLLPHCAKSRYNMAGRGMALCTDPNAGWVFEVYTNNMATQPGYVQLTVVPTSLSTLNIPLTVALGNTYGTSQVIIPEISFSQWDLNQPIVLGSYPYSALYETFPILDIASYTGGSFSQSASPYAALCEIPYPGDGVPGNQVFYYSH